MSKLVESVWTPLPNYYEEERKFDFGLKNKNMPENCMVVRFKRITGVHDRPFGLIYEFTYRGRTFK